MLLILFFLIPFMIALSGFFLIRIVKKISIKLERANESHATKTTIYITKNIFIVLISLVSTILILSTIPALKNVAFSLLASSGIIVTAIGFIAQHILSNIISGFFLQTARPFSIGDTIKIDGAQGKVEEILLYYTILRTIENSRIIIPHSLLQTTMIENKGKNEHA